MERDQINQHNQLSNFKTNRRSIGNTREHSRMNHGYPISPIKLPVKPEIDNVPITSNPDVDDPSSIDKFYTILTDNNYG